MGIEGKHLNIIKAIYDKPTATIEQWEAESFSSEIGNKDGHSPHFYLT